MKTKTMINNSKPLTMIEFKEVPFSELKSKHLQNILYSVWDEEEELDYQGFGFN